MDDSTVESQTGEFTTTAPEGVSVFKRKSRFVEDDELETIDLGDGDWVKIPARISYEISEKFQFETDPQKRIDKTLELFVKEWNLVDREGKVLPITLPQLKKLSTIDLEKIFSAVLNKINMLEVPKAD